ncbi:putative membrane protein [Paenibacillus cellulosilyticus]|uniref:Putative membrane protein n=1 Tax=Paenibacillus cellulosilyticus TaxID=375489 RepID=A0A2V2YXY7_9BACL|nr:DMT family transporter [Paenibacillus cellulosilyticus]PWV97821.1 putative membrane protein [Paenibacillus cellulosilyticus]QKS47000.1 DMT family transporter [Paenibacillus cellulosilyticus]
MWLLTAIGSAILFGLAGWWMKVSQMKGGSSNGLLFGLYVSGTLGFGIHSLVEGTLDQLADWRLLLAGIIIGAGSAWGNAVFMKALECGPASLTSPLTNMNIALVIGMGIVVYGEPISAAEAVGIALLLFSVVLISIRFRESMSVTQRRWFLFVAAAILLFAVRNGGLKVTEQLDLPSAPVLLVGYALSMLWFGLLDRSERNQIIAATKPNPIRTSRIGFRWGLLAGIFSYAGLQLYAIALETGKASIAAPIFATNSIVVALGAIVLYRERLTKQQWFAFALTLAGLVVIKL